jgi:hypothetical protein
VCACAYLAVDDTMEQVPDGRVLPDKVEVRQHLCVVCEEVCVCVCEHEQLKENTCGCVCCSLQSRTEPETA